jgi:hypothetical protein
MWSWLGRAIAKVANFLWTQAGGREIAIAAFQVKAIALFGI